MCCSCLISERMLIQGTNRSDIPEAELHVCWNKDSWRRAWDSGKGEMEVLLSWIEPGDFTNFPLFFIACFFSFWRTAQFQWCIFLMPGLLSQEGWAAGTALPAPPQSCFIHLLVLPGLRPCPCRVPALYDSAPAQKEPVDGSPGLQTSCDAKQSPDYPLCKAISLLI